MPPDSLEEFESGMVLSVPEVPDVSERKRYMELCTRRTARARASTVVRVRASSPAVARAAHAARARTCL